MTSPKQRAVKRAKRTSGSRAERFWLGARSGRFRVVPTRTRFRAATAYWITLRILSGYAWLRLWRLVLGPSLYNTKLVERHRRTSKRLVAAILELGGLFIKVGQLISILTNFLPQEFRAELEQLQDRVPARPLDEVIARIRSEFAKSPEELFASFDAE